MTAEGNLLCLDGKVNVDSNALYRQPELVAMRDKSQEDAREIEADEWELNYVALEGNIGCMVNGAGSGDGNDGHHQTVRWSTCQLPRRRWHGDCRARSGSVQNHPLG